MMFTCVSLCHGTRIAMALPGRMTDSSVPRVSTSLLLSTSAIPLALRVVGSGEWSSVSLSPKRDSNWSASSSVRWVSWIARIPIPLSLIICGTCIHLWMSPDLLPLMFREARHILVLTLGWRGASLCAGGGGVSPPPHLWGLPSFAARLSCWVAGSVFLGGAGDGLTCGLVGYRAGTSIGIIDRVFWVVATFPPGLQPSTGGREACVVTWTRGLGFPRPFAGAL
jgi:hypothetical protein